MASQKQIKALPVITITTSAQKLTSLKIKATMVEIHTVSTNSGSVYLGDSGVLSTVNIPITANVTKSYTPSEISSTVSGDYFDLSEIYVLGTAGDLVRVQYIGV